MEIGETLKSDSGREYQLVRNITDRKEKGGEADVFIAKPLDDPLSVKVLKLYKENSNSRRQAACYHQEKESLETLQGFDGVIKMLDYSDPRKNYFLILEYIDGGNFESAIEKKGLGNFSLLETLSVGIPIAKTLTDIVEEKGIVHRDLKGANILLTKQALNGLFSGENSRAKLYEPGSIKLCDFALSLNNGRSPVHDLTRLGFFVGSGRYCSPEIINGEIIGEDYDHRGGPPADVWALGIILRDMIAKGGAMPGITGPMATFDHIRFDPPITVISTYGEELYGLDDLLLKTQEKDTETRPTMREVYETLLEIKKKAEEEARVNPPANVMSFMMPQAIGLTP